MIYKTKRETKTYNEQYNEEIQRMLINMLISDPHGYSICRSILKTEYFDDKLQPAVQFIMDYTDEFKQLPAVEQVKAKSNLAVEKFSENELHTDYLTKEVEHFCQYKAMELAVLDGVELLQTGRAGEIVERAKSALTISLMSDIGTAYFDDPETRLRRLIDKSGIVSTGWKGLDDKLYGGITRGGLNIFAANSGAGKSLFLQNLALNWVEMGFNVLYISLELSEDLIGMRLDAMVTGQGTKELIKDIGRTANHIHIYRKKVGAGSLYLKKLPEGGTTVNTIRAYMKEFQIKTGLKPDALLIDYLDLMYPTNNRIDPSDQFIKDKYVAEEIRGLMHETNTFGATASQLNRSSVDAEVYSHSHIAGGISKINTADNVFGIVSNQGMRERGIYKLQFLKTRSSSAVGQEIELGYNTLSLRIVDGPIMEDVDTPLVREDLRKNAREIQTGMPPPFRPSVTLITEDAKSVSKIDRMRLKSGVGNL